MRARVPLLAALAVLGVAGLACADLIIFKDGFIAQGKVSREGSAEFDSIDRSFTFIPKGFFFIDDGPRRIYFSPNQVGVAERLNPPAEERFRGIGLRMIINARIMPPLIDVAEVGKWDLKKWTRDYYFKSPGYARIGVKQIIGEVTPYFIRVDAATKFRWSSGYLTREWDPDTLVAMLRNHPAISGPLKPKVKARDADKVARHMRLCDFCVQAGWFDRAEKELANLLKAHPDQKSRVNEALTTVAGLRARDQWERIKRLHASGQFVTVGKQLATFPMKAVAGKIKGEIRELQARMKLKQARIDEARTALKALAKEAKGDSAKLLATAAATIETELHAVTVDRLDAFLGQVREAERRKKRKLKPPHDAAELLSLAVTGWILGSPSAEAVPTVATDLWKTREAVLEYLRETDGTTRKKILADYQKSLTSRVELDEVAQLIDHLPPVEPAKQPSTAVAEHKIRLGRTRITYHLKLPPEYTHNRPYPVLFVLHQGGESAQTTIKRWEDAAAEHGYILAAPEWESGIGGAYTYSEAEHDTVLDTLRDLRRRYQVDSDRVFLFGLGEGAKMAFDVGLAHPDLFAGAMTMAAGPSRYAARYWRNAQYLPFYCVNGTRAGDSNKLLREQFENWVLRGYPTMWIEYKGRGIEWLGGEVPGMFDWMRLKKRPFPLKRLGTDGNGTVFGNEFCTLREGDNRFYWLSTSSIAKGNIIAPGRWTNFVQPASMTARIDREENKIYVKTQGLRQISIWLGRGPKGQMMVDFDKPLQVYIGLRNHWNRKVIPSLAVMLEDLYKRGDRKHLFMARIDLRP